MADEFGKKVEAFGQSIWRKAQRTVDIVGINNDIAAKERQLDDLYAEIGEAYCKAHANDAAPEFSELTGRAHALSDAIAELRASILRMKGYRQCPSCAAMVDEDARFCPRCGAAMPQETPEPEAAPVSEDAPPEPSRCSDCGEPISHEDAFCPLCGAKRD